jgi:hypothetical protein
VAALAAGAQVSGVSLAGDDAGVIALADEADHATIAAAGLWAERCAGYQRAAFSVGDWASLGRDGATILALADTVDMPAAVARSRDLVRANWDHVQALADVLEDHPGYLVGSAIHAWWDRRQAAEVVPA